MQKKIYQPTTLDELSDAINQARTGDEVIGTPACLERKHIFHKVFSPNKTGYICGVSRLTQDEILLETPNGTYVVNTTSVVFQSHNSDECISLGTWAHPNFKDTSSALAFLPGGTEKNAKSSDEYLIGHCRVFSWGLLVASPKANSWRIFINKPESAA